MIVGTKKTSDANRYRLYVWLYEKNGTELTLLECVESSNITDAQLTPNGKIMVASTYANGREACFTMWRPTTLENAQAALERDYTIVSAE